MQSESSTKKAIPRKPLGWRLVPLIAAIFYLSLLGIFAITHHFSSGNAAQYLGQFGDFIGGLLNPLFSIVSIYLLVASLEEQRAATVDGRKQNSLDQVLNVANNLAEQASHIAAEPIRKSERLMFMETQLSETLYDEIIACPVREIRTVSDLLEVIYHQSVLLMPAYEDMRECVKHEQVIKLRAHLLKLSVVLQTFHGMGGTKAIGAVYGVQFRHQLLPIAFLEEAVSFEVFASTKALLEPFSLSLEIQEHQKYELREMRRANKIVVI